MRKIINVLAAVLISVSYGYADDREAQCMNAMKVVENFCLQEFNGYEETRYEMAWLTDNYRAKYEEMDQEFGGKIVMWDSDPIFVVRKYDLGECKFESDSIHVEVQYDRVFKTNGIGTLERVLIPDQKDGVIISYKLMQDGDSYLIVDPPTPRISKDALIKYYQDVWLKNADDWKYSVDQQGNKTLKKAYISIKKWSIY